MARVQDAWERAHGQQKSFFNPGKHPNSYSAKNPPSKPTDLQRSHASSPSLRSRRRPQGYTARRCWPSQHDFYRNKHIKCTRNIQGRIRDSEMNSRLRIGPLGLGRGCFPGSTTVLLKSIFVVLVSTPALQSLHCGVQPLVLHENETKALIPNADATVFAVMPPTKIRTTVTVPATQNLRFQMPASNQEGKE